MHSHRLTGTLSICYKPVLMNQACAAGVSPEFSSKCKVALLVQALLEALLDAVGAALAPTDSPALLSGLVDVQTAPQLKLLHKVPFCTPVYKVSMLQAPYQADKRLCIHCTSASARKQLLFKAF